MSVGKTLRMQRIINPESGKTLMAPIDHGAGEGPMEGLEDPKKLIEDISKGGADVIIGHMGIGTKYAQYKKASTAFMYHLSVSTRVNAKDKNDKVLANSVESAMSMGADGISVHINLGSDNESNQLHDLGFVASECYRYGLPLLAMMYPRGEGLTDDPKSVDMVSMAARIGAELGADIVKTYYTGDKESFKKVVDSASVPVVIVGGAPGEGEEKLFTTVQDALSVGGAGICFGRNIFQHPRREKLVFALNALIHKGVSIKEAMDRLEARGTYMQDSNYLNSLVV